MHTWNQKCLCENTYTIVFDSSLQGRIPLSRGIQLLGPLLQFNQLIALLGIVGSHSSQPILQTGNLLKDNTNALPLVPINLLQATLKRLSLDLLTMTRILHALLWEVMIVRAIGMSKPEAERVAILDIVTSEIFFIMWEALVLLVRISRSWKVASYSWLICVSILSWSRWKVSFNQVIVHATWTLLWLILIEWLHFHHRRHLQYHNFHIHTHHLQDAQVREAQRSTGVEELESFDVCWVFPQSILFYVS